MSRRNKRKHRRWWDNEPFDLETAETGTIVSRSNESIRFDTPKGKQSLHERLDADPEWEYDPKTHSWFKPKVRAAVKVPNTKHFGRTAPINMNGKRERETMEIAIEVFGGLYYCVGDHGDVPKDR